MMNMNESIAKELKSVTPPKKRFSSEDIKTRYYGEKGTPERERFESVLELDLACEQIKKLRKAKDLTQDQLGAMIGVKKAQISRLEKGDTNVTVGTLVKVFKALNANVSLKIEMDTPENTSIHI
ncbi:transcriptional regulator [Adhaeribacter aerolatus]|uniref:Transcriptional regulator n=1 Tax=Adhaeribacter aerolatus TaxID=670289 RepID=A0A512B5S6_9BACT|nr:helix-turn-helix transcriptional regulator [Adhaeribacter aerolatus]GEO07325.1 transcriptional regulator [Adhaeribacter aerolatus]